MRLRFLVPTLLASVLLGRTALAITLPDTTGSCNNGPDPCFAIANVSFSPTAGAIMAVANQSQGNGRALSAIDNSTGGCGLTAAVYGLATGIGTGVKARSVSGTAFAASGSTYFGLSAVSTSGIGVSGTGAGVAVWGRNTTGSGWGVIGVGFGTACIYGDNPTSGGWAGFFNGDFSAQSYTETSDARLKKDVENLKDGLATVLRLRPVTFNWIKDADPTTEQIGLVAQEVEQILPGAVHADSSSGTLTVDYLELVPVLVKAIRERNDAIEKQKQRVAALTRVSQRSDTSPGLQLGMVGGFLCVGMFMASGRKRKRRWLLLFLPFLLLSSHAQAITLPDTFSSCANGTNPCFRISSTGGEGSSAIKGTSMTGPGSAVLGTSINGYALQASSSTNQSPVFGRAVSGPGLDVASQSGTAIIVNSPTNHAIFTASNGGTVNSMGLFGHTLSTGSSAIGVKGTAVTGGIGIYGNNNGTATLAGLFNGDVSARGFYNSSDARLKTNIHDAPNSLNELLRLRPVTFRWKDLDDKATSHVGFIAQDVQPIFPALVHTDPRTGMLTVNYTEVIPLAIKALKEQQAEMDKLDATIAALERAAEVKPSSPITGHLGMGLGLGLLPLGLVVALRKKKGAQKP